ncbi:MAG TPA: phosphotransferase, partial [Bacteroidia bacterium]|nr:phosphotransferase [Bacteroidia bacterium]
MNALSTALQLFDLSGKVDTISSDSFKKIYKVYSKDGVYFLRLCNDQVYNKEEIESEISFLEILRNSGFNTMSAKKSINELSTEYIQTENNNVIATCCREVIGHHLRFHEFNNSYFYSLGELTAKLHVQSSLINQKKVNLQRPIAYQRAFRLFEKHSNHMDFNLFRKCVHLYDQFSSLEKKEDSFGLIHTDITRNNIILNGREYYLIDLGDLSYS